MATGRSMIIYACVRNLVNSIPTGEVTDEAIWDEIVTMPKSPRAADYFRYMSCSPKAIKRLSNEIRQGIEARRKKPDDFGMGEAVKNLESLAMKLLSSLENNHP